MVEQEIPIIEVGIVKAGKIRFRLLGGFRTVRHLDSPESVPGSVPLEAHVEEGCVVVRQGETMMNEGPDFRLQPDDAGTCSFILEGVTIGIGFHWQQAEQQEFRGALKLMADGDEIQVVNVVGPETYLESVISSEMRADCSPGLLKAHAIISRSWLLAQLEKRNTPSGNGPAQLKGECIRWHDREEHKTFHVCADDHCQRYQGITRTLNPEVRKAVRDTRGQVLTHDGGICDARYSKCCGGVVEQFEYCWEPAPHPYLQRLEDHREPGGLQAGDLKVEANAVCFIKSRPPAFCNTSNPKLLRQVLNDYDLQTGDFFRWKVSWSQEEIAGLIRERSGSDFGNILDLQPVERGESGRLVKLRIVGAKRSLVIGKELEIRRWLSHSHLYSAAFYVEKQQKEGSVPEGFTFHGAGWGHGVGLCQVGAAVMASEGYSHREILFHYFPKVEITKAYER